MFIKYYYSTWNNSEKYVSKIYVSEYHHQIHIKVFSEKYPINQ